jgi:hypothetical protein
MKKFYMILAAAVAALTMSAQPQNYAEVNVGTIGEIYNASYFDMAPTNFYVAHTGVQMLYTPDLLTDMNGKKNVLIKKLDFYFNSQTYEEIVRNVKIYLQEISATEFAVNDEGVKQFFYFSNPVKETEISYNMLEYFGDDVCMSLDFEPFAFTPGKTLLVTMVFDAQDDDNCTMGSDYAPFYTSGIRNKAMTYTNNWNSFIDYAWSLDFPNATATLGCGTNVELPVTTIGYNYEEDTPPTPPTPTEETAAPTFNGYTTDGIHAYFVQINPTEPSTIYYRVQFPDGSWSDWAEYEDILSFTGNGKYRVEAYAVAPNKLPSTEIAYEFVVSPFTGIAEMNADKAVAGIRYFNMAGQEMQEANGMTIVVTTYTDGTTSTVKVVK